MAGENIVSIELSVDERQNSLALHRRNLIMKYQDYLNRVKLERESRRGGEKDILYYLNRGYSFTSCFAEVMQNKSAQRDTRERTDISHRWRPSGSDEASEQEELRDQYGINKVMLCKIMHLIDCIIIRISNNNIDPSILGETTDVRASRLGLIWLFCESKDPRELDVQDMNRFYNLLLLQVSRDVSEETQNRDSTYNELKTISVYNQLKESLYSGKTEEISQRELRGYLSAFKKTTKQLIREMFSVYDELLIYRDYLLSTNIVHVSKGIIEETEQILVLAETIKLIIIERFTTYVKIGNLNLSHSELPNGWFNRSELSDSNFVNSVFRHARFENAILRNCDLSICDMMYSVASSCDFTGCNFSFSNLSGMDLSEALLNNCQLGDALFRDVRTDSRLPCAEYFENSPNISPAYNDLCKERIKELEYLSQNKEALEDGHRRFIQNALLQRLTNASGEPGDLYYLTVVADRSADSSARLTIGKSEDGYFNTVLDASAEIISNEIIEPYVQYQRSRVISPELFAELQRIDNIDINRDRESRLRRYGTICLHPAILRNASVSDAIMPRADLSHVDISDASFGRTDASSSVMHYTNAKNAFFRGANVSNASLFSSTFKSANFADANLIGTVFIDCDLFGVSFSKALMLNSVFINSEQKKPYLGRLLKKTSEGIARMRSISNLVDSIDDADVSARNMSLVESDWRDAQASNAHIIGMNMDRSHFDGADMKSATIFNCIARWSGFEKTDMSYGLLMGLSFHQSSMEGIQLSKARIFASEFSGCRLNGSTFIGSRCDKVIFYDADLRDSNFSHAQIYNCTFWDVNLCNTNMANAIFENVVFCSVDFTQCIGIDNATFINCVFLEVNAEDTAKSPSSGDNRRNTFSLTPATKLTCTSDGKQSSRRFTNSVYAEPDD